MSGHLRRIAPEAACFLLVAAAYGVHFALAGYDRFYYDAAGYWESGKLFGRDGAFSLTAFYHPIRGYSFPLLNYGLQVIADAIAIDDVTIVRLTGSLLAATLGVVVAPRVAKAIFPGAAVGWGRILALNVLVFLFWRDHFQFPLSDFPALVAACVGLLGLLRATPAGYVAAGVAFGLAANMRQAYVPVVLIAVVVAALLPRTPKSWRRRTASVALVLAAAFIVSLPQVAINSHHHGSLSPTVPEADNVSRVVLTWGLQTQKNETFVGPADVYEDPLVFYLDPTTRDLVAEEALPVTSRRHYARIVLRHPEAMAASYALHIFNGLDVRYPTPYIRDLEDRWIVLPLVQFTLVFVAITYLVLPDARRRLGRIHWLGITLLTAPILLAIPTTVSPRYFLPVHLLIYMLACFGPATRTLFAGSWMRRAGLALFYATLLTIGLALSAATQRQIEHPIRGDAQGAATTAFRGSATAQLSRRPRSVGARGSAERPARHSRLRAHP